MKYKSIFLRLLAFACVIDLLVKVRRSMAKRLTFTVMLSAEWSSWTGLDLAVLPSSPRL